MDQRITVTVTVDIDPMFHGFGLPDTELEDRVLHAIADRPGLVVIPNQLGIPAWAAEDDSVTAVTTNTISGDSLV